MVDITGDSSEEGARNFCFAINDVSCFELVRIVARWAVERVEERLERIYSRGYTLTNRFPKVRTIDLGGGYENVGFRDLLQVRNAQASDTFETVALGHFCVDRGTGFPRT